MKQKSDSFSTQIPNEQNKKKLLVIINSEKQMGNEQGKD